MDNIVSVGLGLASTLAMPMVLKADGIEARYVTCLLPNEHPDAFWLKKSVEARLGIVIENIGTGKTPIDIFRQQNFLGNTLFDNCSRVLKREAMAAFMAREYPNGATIHVGIGAYEIDRELAIRKNWQKSGYRTNFPLIDKPYINRKNLMVLCEKMFGYVPEMYRLGFEHQNCHGACIKAGKYQWAMVLKHYPDVYAEWEKCEKDIRLSTGKDIAILREMKKGVKGYVTLEEFRKRGEKVLPDEKGDTGCKSCEAI